MCVWRTVAGAVVVVEARVEGVLRVHAWLLNASSGSAIRVLVDGGLQLLEEAVDVLQIVLGASVGHGQRVGLGEGALGHCAARAAHHAGRGAAIAVHQTGGTAIRRVAAVGAAGRVAKAGADGQRQVLRLEPLADVVVVAGVNGTTLNVPQEVVQSLNGPLARIHALQVPQRVARGVVDLAIARVLLLRLLLLLGGIVELLVASHVCRMGGIRMLLRQVLSRAVVTRGG